MQRDPLGVEPLEPGLLQVLAHDPPDIGVVRGEPALHSRLAGLGQGGDGDAPAVAEALSQHPEPLRPPVGRGGDRLGQGFQEVERTACVRLVAEEARLADRGSRRPALEVVPTRPWLDVGEEPWRVPIAEPLEAEHGALADAPALVGGGRAQLRQEIAPPLGQEPPDSDEATDHEVLVVRRDQAPKDLFVALVRHGLGQLEVRTRARQARVLEEVGLPARGERPERFPVLVPPGHCPRATGSPSGRRGGR